MTTYVALLRGINVGGNTIIKMVALKTCFEGMGFTDVTTYINSGNVIFRAADADPRKLEIQVEQALAKDFGFEIRVVIRSYIEIKDLLQHLPVSWESPDVPLRCNVIFLHHSVDKAELVDELKPKTGIDELHYYKGTLLWSSATSNITKSGLPKVIGTPIYKGMTIRIVNTLRKIAVIMEQTNQL